MQKKMKISLFFMSSILIVMSTSLRVSSQNVEKNEREDRRKFDYYFYEAVKNNGIGKYAEAFDLFSFCNSIDSTNAEVQFQIGNYFRNMNQPENAIPFLSYAVRCDEDNFPYNLVLASAYEQSERNSDAIAIYEKIRLKQPDNLELIFALSSLYARIGDYQKAIEYSDEVENVVGITDNLSINKFKLYSALGETEKSYEELKKLISRYPDELRYVVALAEVYINNDEDDLAKDLLESKIAENDSDPIIIITLLYLYDKEDQKDKSEDFFWRSMENERLDITSKNLILTQYITMLQSKGVEFDRLNKIVSKLLKKNPNDNSLKNTYGKLLFNHGEEQKALDLLESIVKDDASNIEALQTLLDIYAKKSDIEKVLEVAEKGISYYPEVPAFYYYLGAAKYQKDLYDDALSAFTTGLKHIDQGDNLFLSEFYGLIGDLHYREGRKKEAYANYEDAIKHNPSNLSVLNNYSYFLSIDGVDLYKAEQMSGATIKAEPDNPTFLDTYGWILFKQEAYDLAKSYIEKAISKSVDGPSAEMLEHYGDVLFKTGELSKALEQWKEAKKKGSDSPLLDQKINKKKYLEK